jgi:Papain-like cysteine protease AvrRpt2
MTNICLTVPYHQQDSDMFCGEATAQMILASRGNLYQQAELSNGLSCSSCNGGTSPQALQDLLNEKLPSEPFFSQRWDVNMDEGCQTIVAGLLAGSGVAAMVNGSSHWVLVTGVNLVGDPAQKPYTIDSFFINDPEPETAAILRADQGYRSPPLPHDPMDTCGHKGVYGSASTQVPLCEWRDTYWSAPCTIGDQIGYVTVSTAAPAQKSDYFADYKRTYAKQLAEFAPARVHPSTVRSLSYPEREAVAKRAAERGIRDHGILAKGPLAERLAGYHLGDLTYHTDLGDPPRHSYQIRLMRGVEQIGTACVDAETLKFRGVQAPASIMPTPAEMREITLGALKSRTASLRDILGPFELAHELFTIHPALVWRPCRQSMSRYYPFIQVNLAGTILYVGLDGRVHRRLTPHDPE